MKQESEEIASAMVRLPAPTYRRLRLAAVEDGDMSFSRLARRVLEEYLSQHREGRETQ